MDPDLPDEREYILRILKEESELRKRQQRALRRRMVRLEHTVKETGEATKRMSVMVHKQARRNRFSKTLLAVAVFAAPHLDPVALWHFLVGLF